MRRFVTLSAMFWLAQTALLAGGRSDLSLRWDELAPAVNNKKVALVLPDGTQVQGKVRSVSDAGLRMRVSKTTDRRAVPKGDALIPRRSVTLIRVTDYRKIGRVLCTVGAVAATGIAIAASDPGRYEGPMYIIAPAVGTAATAGMGVAGYYIGKRVDKRTTDIRVVPE